MRLIDTAPVYGFGRSEEIVGKALANGRRDQVALATEVDLNWNDDHEKVRRDAAASRIEREVEDSLKRLQTDRIDIYQVHWPDPKTPMEATARALENLCQAGKIRAIGVSNFSSSQMDELQKSVPLQSLQPPCNLFERDIEKEILPYCRENGIATITYGGLCRGLMTGKMREDTELTGDDLRKNNPKFQGDRYRQYLNAVAELDTFARERYQKKVGICSYPLGNRSMSGGFNLVTSTEIVFGRGQIAQLNRGAANLGGRVLVVHGSNPARLAGIFESLTAVDIVQTLSSGSPSQGKPEG